MSRDFAYTENLLACMQKRLELLQALLALSEAQVAAASDSEVDATLGLLARKQLLLEELADVQTRLAPYMQDEPEQRVWSSSGRREQCQLLAAQGQQLLQTAMQLEQGVLDQMSSRRDAVAAQLQDGRDSILAHTAYKADSLLGASTLDIGDL